MNLTYRKTELNLQQSKSTVYNMTSPEAILLRAGAQDVAYVWKESS